VISVQKEQIKKDWHELKDEFIPVKNAFGIVGRMTHADKSNPLLNVGLKVASDVFLKNFVLAKAGWATRLAIPFVVKNFSSHLIVEKGADFLHKLSNIFKGSKRSKRTDDRNVANHNGQTDFSEHSTASKTFDDE
jgi:hypothetical protein